MINEIKNIILLKGLANLKEPINLIPELGLILDIPRSKDEIDYVEEFMVINEKNSSPWNNFPRLAREANLREIEKKINIEKGEIYKNWLIAKYDDHKFFSKSENKFKELVKKEKEEISDRDYEELVHLQKLGFYKKKEMINYLHFLSVSLNNLLGDHQTMVMSTVDTMNNQMIREWGGKENFLAINDNLGILQEFSSNVNKVIKNEPEGQRIRYIADTLREVFGDLNEAQDININFVRLTSIIELLVTHRPDFARFNVEDSIRKQFQLKTGILVHNLNEKIDLTELKKDLRKIYDIRSSVAHGDFQGLVGLKESIRNDLYKKLFSYVSLVVTCFLRDPKYIEFLKQS